MGRKDEGSIKVGDHRYDDHNPKAFKLGIVFIMAVLAAAFGYFIVTGPKAHAENATATPPQAEEPVAASPAEETEPSLYNKFKTWWKGEPDREDLDEIMMKYNADVVKERQALDKTKVEYLSKLEEVQHAESAAKAKLNQIQSCIRKAEEIK